MSFSRAIFSHDCPIVWPVVYSAIAGGTGIRSEGRTLARIDRRWPIDLALPNSIRRRAAPLEYWIGTLLSDSAPPARITSACPARIDSTPLVMARFDEAQARLTELPGIVIGRVARNTTSRPRLGACSAGMTTPNTEASISAGSMSDRSTSSAAATPARSTTSMSRSAVPALANGVRQPARIATRPCDPLRRLAVTFLIAGAEPSPRVQTVSAR